MPRHITLVLVVALVGCGSKSASPPTAPSEPATAGSNTAVAPPPPTPTPPPAEKPAEPAKPDPAAVKAELLASETAAWDIAKPVFQKYCATCHTKAGKKAAKKKLDHFAMDTYPPGGHHTGTIGYAIRGVLGLSGDKATMPYDKPGSVKGDDLAKIKAWTDAWEAADKGGAHPPAAPDKDDD